MKEFKFTVKDDKGIHARPAGVIVATAKKFSASTLMTFNDQSYDLKKLLPLMGSGLKKGDSIVVKVAGDDEDACAKELKVAFKENL